MPRPNARFLALAVGLAMAAVVVVGTPVHAEPTAQECASLTADLQAARAAAADALTAEPADLTTATNQLYVAFGVVEEMQETQCLPTIPPAEDADQECLASTLSLLSRLTGIMASLVEVSGEQNPDIVAIVDGMDKLEAEIAEMIDAGCMTPAG